MSAVVVLFKKLVNGEFGATVAIDATAVGAAPSLHFVWVDQDFHHIDPGSPEEIDLALRDNAPALEDARKALAVLADFEEPGVGRLGQPHEGHAP